MEEKAFELYDLKVEVVSSEKPMVYNNPEGAYFLVECENLVFSDTDRFPMYSLAAILSLLPAKQRVTDGNDWMTTDAEIVCPDPHCGGRFRISRLGKRRFTHAETTGLPETRDTPYWQKDDGDA